MHVAVTGGTGMIGRAVVAALRARGDKVTVLTRRTPQHEDEVQWDMSRGIPGVRRLEGLDVVVHLTGEPLATRPWTAHRRKVLRKSRIDSTAALVRSLSKLEEGPTVWVGVGSLGLYGDRGDAWVTDETPRAEGFLADLAYDWEAAHRNAAETLGARVAILRMSIVLSHTGGAFPLMLVPFRYGFGGWLGDGKQFTAWMSLHDTVRALLYLVDTPAADGAFNGSVPEPQRNRAWCKALGMALDKPVFTHAPKWALRGALGDLGNAIFLASCRVRPERLEAAGFSFEDTDVEAVFERELAAMAEQEDAASRADSPQDAP